MAAALGETYASVTAFGEARDLPVGRSAPPDVEVGCRSLGPQLGERLARGQALVRSRDPRRSLERLLHRLTVAGLRRAENDEFVLRLLPDDRAAEASHRGVRKAGSNRMSSVVSCNHSSSVVRQRSLPDFLRGNVSTASMAEIEAPGSVPTELVDGSSRGLAHFRRRLSGAIRPSGRPHPERAGLRLTTVPVQDRGQDARGSRRTR